MVDNRPPMQFVKDEIAAANGTDSAERGAAFDKLPQRISDHYTAWCLKQQAEAKQARERAESEAA